MSEDNKLFLRDRIRFSIVVSLILACLLFLIFQCVFPTKSVVDDRALKSLNEMSTMFNELKDQNQQIIDMNVDVNRKLTALLERRGVQRDENYEALLERYNAGKDKL